MCLSEEASPCVSTPMELGAVEALDNRLLKRHRTTTRVSNMKVCGVDPEHVGENLPLYCHMFERL